MKVLYFAFILLDVAFITLLLILPRSGLESLATFYVLFPLLAVRVIFTVAGSVFAVKRRNVLLLLGAWFGCVISIVGYHYGLPLQPTHKPLYQALEIHARESKEAILAYVRDKQLQTRKNQQKKDNSAQLQLCEYVENKTVHAADIQNMIAAGATVNGICYGQHGTKTTPLLHAIIAQYGHDQIATGRPDKESDALLIATQILLKNGAELDARDLYGNTPLHYAVINQNEKLAEMLLNAGACVYLENDRKESPRALLHYARGRLHKLIRDAATDPAMIDRCPQLYRPKTEDKITGAIEESDTLPFKPFLTQELIRTVRSAEINKAGELIAQGADPNGISRHGTPLHLVVKRCRDNALGMMQLLINSGADLEIKNRKGQTPLFSAVYHCIKAVPHLIEQGANPLTTDSNGRTLFHEIAKRPLKHFDRVAQTFLEAKIPVNKPDRNGQTPLIMAMYSGKDRVLIAQKLLQMGADPNHQDHSGNTILHTLASGRHKQDTLPFIQTLIQQGINIDLKNNAGQTPLMIAMQRKHVELAEVLIKNGANFNVRDKQGDPLIMQVIACDVDKISLLTLLLRQAKIEINAQNEYGRTALFKAFHNNTACLKPARLLLEAGADPNMRNQHGYSVLHRAIFRQREDHTATVKLLSQYGAKINAKDQQGNTPLLYAAKHAEYPAILSALIKHGAHTYTVDDRGNNLLHAVAMNTKADNIVFYRAILKLGISRTAQNKKGQTPLEVAIQKQNQRMIDVLSQ